MVAAVLIVAAGVYYISLQERVLQFPEIEGFVYPDPKPLAPFELIRHDGSKFERSSLRGKWTFVYFGFTSCPDVCPTTLIELNRVQKQFSGEALDTDHQYVFVSLDPKRDTLERLAEYVGYFNDHFIGVTGSTEVLEKFTADVGVLYDYPDGRDSEDYRVDHSSVVALFDPNQRLHAIFSSPHRADDIIDGFRRLLARWRG